MLLYTVIFSLDASAEDCNAIRRELPKASPHDASGLYVKLAECDADAARRIAAATLPSILSGDEGHAAIAAAIEVGASAPAAAWLTNLQSDEQAKAVRAIGDACGDSEAIQQFFIGQATTMGDDFWNQRWYRALGACNAEPIQELLWSELDKGMEAGQSRFFGVLEAYARSAGIAAVPKLVELAQRNDDPEIEVNIIGAFTDAARVGQVGGMDQPTANKAARAIVELAPELSIKAVEQARLTLQTLGAEEEADSLAAVRYAEMKQDDGTYLWGVVAVENASCKGGKKMMQRLNFSAVSDPGNTWPDQFEEKVQASLEVAWPMDLAERCKGEGTTSLLVPSAPFATEADLKAWFDVQLEEAADPAVKKPIRMEQDPLNL
ncbi:MAG: hypothetical protein ACI8RZ_007619 [Myxococcota bacterium]|jgi:hypothetical protein